MDLKKTTYSLFGVLTDEESRDLFLNATCFPAGTPEDWERQLQEHANAGCKTYQEAINRALCDDI